MRMQVRLFTLGEGQGLCDERLFLFFVGNTKHWLGVTCEKLLSHTAV